MKNKIYFSLAVLSLISFSCTKKEKTPAPSEYSVDVAKAEKKEAEIYLDNIGHVEPIISIDITSRIEGQLSEVHFKEGEEVKEGDLLFTIDPRPYKAELERAIGLLEESVADLYIAKDRFLRNKDLIKDEYISQLDFETLGADVAKAEALVKQYQANVDNAKLNLEYCYIYAPVSGKTGILEIDKGNMIYPSESQKIITLNQLEPIYVTFFSTEKDLPKILKHAKEGQLIIKAAFEDLEGESIEGNLSMIDNLVDTSTGLIKLRGIFSNKERLLWPGKFVKTRLILKKEMNVTLIPFKAIEQTSTGPIVFVVKDDLKAELRHVKLGQKQGENIIILSGLSENEKVVTDGQLNLAGGIKVNIKTEEKK